jgi:quercetin dioxygenase-like cupin family protein
VIQVPATSDLPDLEIKRDGKVYFQRFRRGKPEGRLRETGTTLDNGTVFRILELQPGNTPRVHRTDSLDYAVIMSGEIDMELETGEITHLKAGDVVVQRGTVHNWVNRGTEPCVIAFVLIAAKPVEAGGKVLAAFG